jgi:hypothetical protein
MHWTCVLKALANTWPAETASSRAGDRIIGVMIDHDKPPSHPRYSC